MSLTSFFVFLVSTVLYVARSVANERGWDESEGLTGQRDLRASLLLR